MKIRTYALIAALAFAPVQVSARQCVLPDAAGAVNTGKKASIIIAENDHPHFKDPLRKCSFYLPYFVEGYKASGLIPPTQAQCTADPSIVNLSEGFAPFGAFFRSDVGVPDSQVKNYQWQISGPGMTTLTFDSFNAAHVFENPGTYSVTLKVTFIDGSTMSNVKSVKVWPRKGKTYFVDSSSGDDRFNGLSEFSDPSCDPGLKPVGTCAGPWKTATRGFGALSPRAWVGKLSNKYGSEAVCSKFTSRPVTGSNGVTTNVNSCDSIGGITKSILKPGDQVAFKRGQSFEFETALITTNSSTLKPAAISMVETGHWPTAIGVLFTAYGSGAKPVINNVAQAAGNAFNILGVGMFHLAFQDLEFNLESLTQNPFVPQMANRALFLYSPGNMMNLVVNRVDIKKFNQGILFFNAHGVFMTNSTTFDSHVTHMYSETASDVAIINNKFDYSGNHLLYTNMSHGLVKGNTLSRQAFGRTQFRIYGSDPASFRTESVWISDNSFTGWVDPRTTSLCLANGVGAGGCQFDNGKRYNFSLAEFTPNVNALKYSDRIVFKRNTLKNAENMLRISAAANVLVENNIFDNVDASTTPRIQLHFSSFAKRPLDNITIRNNAFVERNPARPMSSVMHVAAYGPDPVPCADLPAHRAIKFSENKILVASKNCVASKSDPGSASATCMLDKSQTGSEGATGLIADLFLSGNALTLTTDNTVISKAISGATSSTTSNLTPTTTTTTTTTTIRSTTVLPTTTHSTTRTTTTTAPTTTTTTAPTTTTTTAPTTTTTTTTRTR